MKRKLGESFLLKAGKSIKAKDISENTSLFPCYGGNGLRGYTDTYTHDGEYNLIGRQGALCGNVQLVSGKFYATEHAVVVTPLIDCNSKWLYYALTGMNLNQYSTGAAQPGLSVENLNKLELDIPNIAQQARIADTLDRVKNVIECRKRELQKLDELVKARFSEMFGDVIHNDKSWNMYQFSDITSSRLGKMLDAKQQTGKYPFPYLANANVQWFRFETDNLNQMDFNESDQEEFKLEDGDLLVCEGGEIGRCAVWHNEIQPCFFQKALHRVRCNQEIVLPDYLAWWFKFNCENGGFAAIEGAKATIAHLPGAKLKQLDVVVPSIELQNEFVVFYKQVNKSKVVVQKALDKAQLLFDSLLQKFFGV